jgi:hypothetical protein
MAKAIKTAVEQKKDEKFIAIFARDDSCDEKYVKVCGSVTEALEELVDWIPEAESAKADGEEPVFAIYKVIEVPLEVKEDVVVSITVELRERRKHGR